MKKERDIKAFIIVAALGLSLLVGLGWLGYKQRVAQDRSNRLFAALRDGSPAEVQAALDEGAGPNAWGNVSTPPAIHSADVRQWLFQILHPARTETALTVAVKSEDPRCVELLLRHGALPDLRNGDGSTALMAAAAIHHYSINSTTPPKTQEQIQVMQALVERGADVNAKDREGSPALAASIPSLFNGTLDVTTTRFLLEHGADPNTKTKTGQTLLEWAMEGPDNTMVPLVSLLLDHGANVNVTDGNGWTPLSRACEWINPALVGTLIKHGANPNVHSPANDMTPLIQAARQGQTGIITLLLDKGADVNAYSKFDSSALFVATQQNRTDVVKLLLARGANPNFVNDFEMRTPALIVAASRNNAQIVRLLLTHGANVNLESSDEGETPLVANVSGDLLMAYAKKHKMVDPRDILGLTPVPHPRDTAVAQILLAAGVNVAITNFSHVSALIYAVAGDNAPMVRLLMAHHANPNVRSSKGESARSLAEKRGYSDLLPLLQQNPQTAQ